MQESAPQSDINSAVKDLKIESVYDEKSNDLGDQRKGNKDRRGWNSKDKKYDHHQKDGWNRDRQDHGSRGRMDNHNAHRQKDGWKRENRDNGSRGKTDQQRSQYKNRLNNQKYENKSDVDDKDRRSKKDNKVCKNWALEQSHECVKTATSKIDPKIEHIKDDPRPPERITKKANARGKGRNTESFDPTSTLVRPDLRIQIGSNAIDTFNKPLKHDDVVIVPELFGKEDDWSTRYKLVDEMRELQSREEKAEWISWHEGAHLISKVPRGCPTYERIIARICQYFNINPKKNVGTRFNWYRDSQDWKPFHHDSAAYNPNRAKTQNITVGASFGATRELAFLRASCDDEKSQQQKNNNNCKLYFPQVNNGVFSFGRDANVLWKHGINALKEEEQDGKGRISIILWGLAEDVIEEEGSPQMLGVDGNGPHANTGGKKKNYYGGKNDNYRNNNRL